LFGRKAAIQKKKRKLQENTFERFFEKTFIRAAAKVDFKE
jgi:hypothetical protein